MSKMNRSLSAVLAAAAVLALAGSAGAVINPKRQPWHLVKRYTNVMACTVMSVDAASRTAKLKVVGVSQGDFAPKEITLTAPGAEMAEAIISLTKGQMIVAFVGDRILPRHEKDILYYAGRGVWYLASLAAPEKWDVVSNADKGIDASSSEIMFGTFNGEPESLWEMMQDAAKGVAYYPAVPLTKFSVKQIADLGKSVKGVAICDLTGDGKCDLLACSAGGVRAFVQDDKGEFADRTEALGLSGVKAASCSAADADADGDADLLLDGVLYRQAGGKFARTSDIPAGDGAVLSAAFFEYNGDGCPDVVVSREDGGLSLYVNPGAAGGAFADKTADAELDKEGNGAGKTGYFEICDWDLDGRMDLIYVAGPGLLLWHNANGAFEASDIGGQSADFGGGTAAFGTIVRQNLPSLYMVCGDQKTLVCEEGGNLTDVMRSGNEIQDPVVGMLMALAEDLNCDGTVDLYAASKAKGMSSFYVANRGYASFLQPEKYQGGKIIPAAAYNLPAWGLAAGDVNHDGAPEVLVGGADGKLLLLINETLAARPEKADQGTINDVRKQIQTRILTVTCPAAKGILGARLGLFDEAGKAVTYRWIGNNVGVGCSGPAAFNLAVREGGTYTLKLRLSDGTVKEQKIALDDKTPRHQDVVIK